MNDATCVENYEPKREEWRQTLARLVPDSQEATVLQCAQAAGGTAKLGDSRLNGIGASRRASKVSEGLSRKPASLAATLYGIRI